MKINGFRRFFIEDFKDVPTGLWFSKLLSGINQFTDPVITALRNNINHQDNIKCEIKNVPFSNMVEVTLGTRFSTPPSGVQVMSVDGAMLLGVASRSIRPGTVGVTLKLSDELPHDVKLIIYE